MTPQDDFNSPVLENVAPLGSEPVIVERVIDPATGAVLPGSVVERVVEPDAPIVVDNTGKTDELSLAVAAESQRNAVFIAEPIIQPCKYQLSYYMDGKQMVEKHVTIDGALASVRRLRVLGIIPATATL